MKRKSKKGILIYFIFKFLNFSLSFIFWINLLYLLVAVVKFIKDITSEPSCSIAMKRNMKCIIKNYISLKKINCDHSLQYFHLEKL